MDKDFTKIVTEQLQAFIDEQGKKGLTPNMDNLAQHLNRLAAIYNNTPKADFNGFTPDQIYQMINNPFGKECPVQLRTLTNSEIEEIPFLKQAIYLMKTLADKELKLTTQGYIPPRLVTELYEMGLPDWNSNYYKQKLEPRVEVVRVLRVALKRCGLIKVRSGKMSLTAKGHKILNDYNTLLFTLMRFLFLDYNTGWLDSYNNMEVANVGRLYSLWLLHHYGDVWRHQDFYAEAYFKAFPEIKVTEAYNYRTFSRTFHFIGICDINDTKEDRGLDFESKTRKREILDKVFSFVEPQKKK